MTAKTAKTEKTEKPDLLIRLRKRKLGKQRGDVENKMIKKYLVNYFDKIKDTKKVARDKNIGVWWLPVFDSFLITIYLSWQLSVGVWIVLDAWQSGQTYIPWYMDSLWELSSFSLTIFMSIITFTILDKIILFFIYVHSYANKLVLQGITKLDMYLWRKTGRDTVVTNFIWKLQRKYMSRSKREREIMTMAFVGMIGAYYGWMILT
jgi:hypothetical protein